MRSPVLLPFCLGLALSLSTALFATRVPAASLFDLGDRHIRPIPELQSAQVNSIVLDIRQDPSGFIWLATTKALIRYDGYDFKLYQNREDDPRSISGNYIQALHFVGEQMWVGTYSDGLSIYNPDSDAFTRIQHDPADPDSLLGNDIRALAGNDDYVVIASRSGVNIFDRSSGRMRRLGRVQGCDDLLARGKLAALAIDRDSLFIGSSHGLCQLPLETQDLSDERLTGIQLHALDEQKVFNIDLMPDGTVWVGTSDKGVAVLERDTDEAAWIPVGMDTPGALHHPWVDDTTLIDGRVWAATAGGGIAVINPETLVVEEHIESSLADPSGLPSNDVSAVFVSRNGIVWIGTYGSGISRYDLVSRAFRVLRHDPADPRSLADPDLRSAIELENGEVWVGSLTSGIQVLSPGRGLLRTYPPQPGVDGALQHGYVKAFAQLTDGDVWVGTGQTGVYRHDPVSDTFTRFTTADGLTDDDIIVLHVHGENTLWIGTETGLTRYDAETETFTPVRLRDVPERDFDRAVWSMASHEGSLWVGTNGGLFVVPAGGDELVAVASDPAAPIADNFVKHLYSDSAGRLWVGTAQGTGILSSWDGETASFLSVNQQLNNGVTLGGNNFEEDSLGRMWAQSTVIDPSDWSYSVVTPGGGWANGGQWVGSNTQLRDGTLLFGGTRGLLMVRPEYYQPQELEPTLTITAAQVDFRPVAPAMLNPLSLQPSMKNFSVEFSALNYSASSRMRYEYMLEGYDNDWISTTSRNRRASYSRLAPGDYVLRIRASNRSGVASERAVPVSQMPAWWETSAFQAFLGLIVLGLLYLLYRGRVAQLERQKRALDQLVDSRTENIRQLAQAGQDITASLDLDEVLTAIYARVSEFMDTRVFVIGTLDEEHSAFTTLLHYEEGKRAAPFSRDLSDEESPASWCLRNQRALIVSDVDELRVASDELRFIERPQPVQSAVFYPLSFGDKTGGFLSLQSYEKAAYGENELQMLKTIAAYAAVAIVNAESHKQLNLAKAEIERVSLTDQLTGLSNRRFLDNLMPGEINRLQRIVAEGGSERLGVVMIDADYFKQVNDTHGHDAGDKVLIQLAQIMKSTCRESDWAIRLGGEEFLVLARVTDKDQLMQLAERLRANVEAHSFAISDDLVLHKTCSIGVSQFPFIAEAFDAVSWEQSITLADHALYLAKESGRNKWIAVFEQAVRDPETFYDAAISDLQAMADSEQIAMESSGDQDSAPLLTAV